MATDTLPLTRKYYTADEINFTPGERSFVAWISVETVDREGDVVVAKGIDFGEYMTNPVVVAIHDYGKWPLGQCEWLKVKSTPKWKGLYGKANVDDDEDTEVVWKKIQGRSVRSVSIGFLPPEDMSKGEWGPPTADEVRRNPHWAGAKRVIRRCQMIEFSVCPIGMNPHALIEAVSKGLHRPQFSTPEVPVSEPDAKDDIVEAAVQSVTLASLETKGAALGRIGAVSASAVLDRLSDSLRMYLGSLVWDPATDAGTLKEKCQAACDEFCDAFVAALNVLRPLDAGAVDNVFSVLARNFKLPSTPAGPAAGPVVKALPPDEDDDEDEPDDDADDKFPVRKGQFARVVKGPQRGHVGKVVSVHRSGLVPDVDDDVPATKGDPACRLKCYKAMGDGHRETEHHVGAKMAHMEKCADLKPPSRKKGLPDPVTLPPLVGKSDAEVAADRLRAMREQITPARISELVQRQVDKALGAV